MKRKKRKKRKKRIMRKKKRMNEITMGNKTKNIMKNKEKKRVCASSKA